MKYLLCTYMYDSHATGFSDLRYEIWSYVYVNMYIHIDTTDIRHQTLRIITYMSHVVRCVC